MTRYLPLCLPLLTACETVVDVPPPPHTPRIALRYTLTSNPADSSFAALAGDQALFVSNSQGVFDTTQLEGRRDATVEIRDGSGAVVERFRSAPDYNPAGGYFTQGGYYRPTLGLVPQTGARYSLRATLPGFPVVESSLVFPAAPVVASASFSPRSGSGGNGYTQKGRLTVTIADDPAADNYYIAFAQILDAQGQSLTYVNVDYDSQNSSVGIGQFQLSSPRQSYSVQPYADAGANGQTLTLASDVEYYPSYCPNPNAPCPQPTFIEVTVSAISADTYQFYLSRRRYYDSEGNPFAEPAPLASNLTNGFGLFGASADTKIRVAL